MSKEKEIKTSHNTLIKKLESNDSEALLKTLKEIEKKGSAALIVPLIKLGMRTDDKSVLDAIQNILFGIKISAAHPIMLNALEEMGANPFRQILLASIWNANINGLDHLDTFVRIAIEGNYFEAVECLTVIEESEGELNEEKILDSLLLLKAYMTNENVKNEAKFLIIEDIMQKVSNLNMGIR